MPETSQFIDITSNEQNRHQAAAVCVAYWDVLQREPTAGELRERSYGRRPSAESIVELYRELLCSPESIGRYALEMPPLLLARVIINQLFGRAPTSLDEIGALAGVIIQAGWLAFVRHVLLQPEVRKRIFGDIQRLAQHGSWTADSEGDHQPMLVEPEPPAATLELSPGPATEQLKGKAAGRKRNAVGAAGKARSRSASKVDAPERGGAGKNCTAPAGRARRRH